MMVKSCQLRILINQGRLDEGRLCILALDEPPNWLVTILIYLQFLALLIAAEESALRGGWNLNMCIKSDDDISVHDLLKEGAIPHPKKYDSSLDQSRLKKR